MSYILDALKKAEAERNAGATPSIHATQPLATASSGTEVPPWRRAWLWILIALLAAALIGFAVWKLLANAPAPATLPATAAVDTRPASGPPSTPMTSAAPATSSPSAPLSTPAAPAEAPENAATVASPPVLQPAPAPEPLRTEPRKTERKAEKATAPENKPAAGTTVPSLRDLPEQIQRQIPPLEIGGYIYSSNPAERSVLINKRLMREGDDIAPGFRLEKMAANGMVLNYKGYRYRSSY